MKFFHLSMSPLHRNKGRSAIAAVAYISGSKIHDARQNLSFDYSRKERIIDSGFHGPAGQDQGAFWNGVEGHHKRGDAITARTFVVALPDKLPDGAYISLGAKMAKQLSDHYGVGVSFALHKSKEGEENENAHAHFIISACTVLPDGTLGKKVNELDPIHCKRNGLQTPAEVIRPWAAELINELQRLHGIQDTVDHRSFKKRGLKTLPTVHEGKGPKAAFHKKENEEIRAINKAILTNEEKKLSYQKQLREYLFKAEIARQGKGEFPDLPDGLKLNIKGLPAPLAKAIIDHEEQRYHDSLEALNEPENMRKDVPQNKQNDRDDPGF